MSHVPLIPFQRPTPQVFLRPEPRIKTAKAVKPKKQKKAKMVTTKKKSKHAFEATNTDDAKQMPPDVRRLWSILDRMDPAGDIFVNDKGILILDGEGPDERRPASLKLKTADVDLLRSFAILDGPKANDPETATGIIFTQYQMIQMAYELGRQAEQRKVASDFTKVAATPPPVAGDYDEEEDEDEDEEFDDDEDMDVIDEDEDDDNDNDNEEQEDTDAGE